MSEERKIKEGTGIEIGTDPDKNYKYADVAIHCSKCGKIRKVDQEGFKKIQTGLMFTANGDTRWGLGCSECGTTLSLVFIENDEPEEAEQEVVEEVKEVKDEVDSKE